MTRHETLTSSVELRPQFPVLDTLRAVGAMAVLSTHVMFQTGEYLDNGAIGTMFARLDVGVAIFFVLSGFLLARPYLAAASMARPLPAPGRYAVKRLARIYPLYVVTVVGALLLVPDNDAASRWSWVTTLTLTSPFTEPQWPHALTQMWSLSAEVCFYAALPVLMWLTLRRGRLSVTRVCVLLALMVAVNVVWVFAVSDALVEPTGGTPGLWLPAFSTWFAVGIGLALVDVMYQRGEQPRSVRSLVQLGAQPGVCWAMAGGAFLISATPLAGPVMFQVGTHAQIVTKLFLYAFIGGVLCLSGIFTVRGAYLRAMARPWMRHLGHVSYGIFCVHLIVLAAIYELGPFTLFRGDAPVVWLLTTVLSVAVAEVLYRTVERPAVALSRRRESGTATQAAAAQQAASTHS